MSFFLLLLLQSHTHIDENHYDKNDGKSEDSIADHELFVGVETMRHSCYFFNCGVKIRISHC